MKSHQTTFTYDEYLQQESLMYYYLINIFITFALDSNKGQRLMLVF